VSVLTALTNPILHKDLSAPVDVYSDWVDACDAVAKDTANQYDAPNPSQLGQRGISKQAIPEETGQDDGYDDDY
jgi:transcription elongation factor Elf1